jgi:hypothetical protein
MEQANSHPQSEAADPRSLLNQLKTEVYEDSDDLLALGLGRPVEQVTGWSSSDQEIDEDAAEKIRALAAARLGEEGDHRSPKAPYNPENSIEQRL